MSLLAAVQETIGLVLLAELPGHHRFLDEGHSHFPCQCFAVLVLLALVSDFPVLELSERISVAKNPASLLMRMVHNLAHHPED